MYHQFLQTVVSPNGWNCVTEIHPRQDDPSRTWARNNPIQFCNSDATDRFIQGLQQRAVETYFGLASYAQVPTDGKGFRAQTNVLALRSFWLDIDAGASKYAKHGDTVYPTQEEALAALEGEITKGILPPPTYVVSSGEGLHVYWCATEDIAPAEWLPAADKLGQYCKSVGLRVDSSRTTDTASVLRPVGTVHFKSGKHVTVLNVGNLFTKQQLLSKLSALPVANTLRGIQQATNPLAVLGLPPSGMPMGTPSSMDGFAEYKPASFGKIIDRQKYERTGCAQLLWAYENQQDADEPTWFGALSVAQFCVTDRDEWVHKLSHLHPSYTRGETEAKAAQAKGPRSCASFEAHKPDLCKGCPHYGKITNPIVLGSAPPLLQPPSGGYTLSALFYFFVYGGFYDLSIFDSFCVFISFTYRSMMSIGVYGCGRSVIWDLLQRPSEG